MIQQHLEDGGRAPKPGPTPNELDQSDESQNAADITRAGEARAAADKRQPDRRDDRPLPRSSSSEHP